MRNNHHSRIKIKLSFNIYTIALLFLISLGGCTFESPKESASKTETLGNTIDIPLPDYVPPYSGSPYATINNNIPFFSNEDLSVTAFENYSPLDSLGRCGVAYANICKEIMPTEKRGEIGQIRPSGWHTVKYNDLIDGNYLYNRCHLIGYQLAGENANEKNLITGTRYLNVVGMLPFEDKVDDYVDQTNNHVLYRVTPYFWSDNLVASGVLMEALSVEDEGSGISFNVFCYNVQPNITIDYLTGESYTEKTNNDDNNTVEASSDTADEKSTSATQTYILNTNTRKFHYPNCRSVSQMAEHNNKEIEGTKEEVIGMGYDPCGNCHP